MKKIGIIANCNKDRAVDVLKRIEDKSQELSLEVYVEKECAIASQYGKPVSLTEMFSTVDAIIALGGDGTMLRAVRALEGKDIPVIGFNIGSLGFMTSVAEEEFDKALLSLSTDDLVISQRDVLECQVTRDEEEITTHRALNEVVVGMGPSLRVVTLLLSVDDEFVTSYACDGLIVATPTGSTGHSLSAGGPVLSPDTSALVVCPIAPNTLSSRPLVLSDKSILTITAEASSGELLLALDGQVDQLLKQGDVVTIKRSAAGARFIHLPGHSYFGVLRQKLRWGGSLT